MRVVVEAAVVLVAICGGGTGVVVGCVEWSDWGGSNAVRVGGLLPSSNQGITKMASPRILGFRLTLDC